MSPVMSKIIVHTDGSCWPNPGGPGGWAYQINVNGRVISGKGSHPGPTTNNRMEIQAAIEALKLLPEWSEIEINTDSQYLRNAGMKWIKMWKRKGWVTREGGEVRNMDQWVELDRLCSRRKVKWNWVRGHQNKGNANDNCDAAATNARLALADK